MRMNYLDIKRDILDNWEFIPEHDPKSYLDELADSAVPVYYGDIIEDWREMPNEYDNSFQTLGYPITEDTTITKLMAIDLYQYYTDEYYRIYDEILDEKDTDN